MVKVRYVLHVHGTLALYIDCMYVMYINFQICFVLVRMFGIPMGVPTAIQYKYVIFRSNCKTLNVLFQKVMIILNLENTYF